MIQRIQSLYLLLTTAMSVLFLKSGLIEFTEKTGSLFRISLSGLYRHSGLETGVILDNLLPLAVALIIIPILSFIIIFLYKRRSIQILLVKILFALIALSIIALSFYSIMITVKYEAAINPSINLAVPLIQLFLSFLAYRGIKKDDDLVKSYDRLR
jgi:hypothetical protein